MGEGQGHSTKVVWNSGSC